MPFIGPLAIVPDLAAGPTPNLIAASSTARCSSWPNGDEKDLESGRHGSTSNTSSFESSFRPVAMSFQRIISRY